MKKLIYNSLVFSSLMSLPLFAFADPEGGMGCYGSEGYQAYGSGGMMGSGSSFMLGYGWVLPMLFWAIIIIGVAALVGYLLKGQRTQIAGSGGSPSEILKKRFAQGEINKEEFQQMKKEIEI